MKATKQQIRERLQAKRRSLSAEQAANASQEIVTHCLELIDWEKTKTLHCYVPLMEQNEVDAWRIVEYAWQNFPSITTAIPVLNKTGSDYASEIVTPDTTWIKNRRIPEPVGGKKLDDSFQFDVIIVPMIGFDGDCHRIGHGSGWYDRFLINQKGAQTIGVCYTACLVAEGLPSEDHDIALHCVVTENKVIKPS